MKGKLLLKKRCKTGAKNVSKNLKLVLDQFRGSPPISGRLHGAKRENRRFQLPNRRAPIIHASKKQQQQHCSSNRERGGVKWPNVKDRWKEETAQHRPPKTRPTRRRNRIELQGGRSTGGSTVHSYPFFPSPYFDLGRSSSAPVRTRASLFIKPPPPHVPPEHGGANVPDGSGRIGTILAFPSLILFPAMTWARGFLEGPEEEEVSGSVQHLVGLVACFILLLMGRC